MKKDNFIKNYIWIMANTAAFIILIIIIFAVIKPKIIIKEVPVNVTVITEKEIIKYINLPCINTTFNECNSSYVNGLIRNLKACEYRENRYYNLSYQEIFYKFEECNNTLLNVLGLIND